MIKFLLFAFIFLNLDHSHASAEICTKNHCFSATNYLNDKELKILGVSDFNYLFFKVYSAALYIEPQYREYENFSPLSGDSSIILLLKYHREITKKDFCDSTKMYINKMNSFDPKVDSQVNLLCESYESVISGDTYSLEFNKDNAETCLKRNGVRKFCTNGLNFFKAYAGIWLSASGVSDEFAKELTGE